MIHTRLNDQLLIVLNEADGPFSLAELLTAAEETKVLTKQGYCVIWDFRKLRVNDVDPVALTTIGKAISGLEPERTPQKRAILVGSTEDSDLINTFIGRTSIAWPWCVFLDFGEALQWLED